MKNKRKNIIHVLAIGAMALSWFAIGNVHNHLHPALKLANKTNTKKANGKRSKPSETTESEDAEQPKPITVASLDVGKSSTQTLAHTQAPAQKPATQIPVSTQQPISSPSASSKTGISIEKTKIDSNFIRLVEGSVSKGYVPLAKTTKSGVTVGDGVDLGQMNKTELEKLPISQSLKSKLFAYIGLKKEKAKMFLKTHPLTVSANELEQLDTVAANKILKPLAAEYQKSTGKLFSHLPAQAQTALFSVAYQNGPGFMKKSQLKPFWNCILSGNWSKASQTLKNLKQYSGRRHQEAQLLDQIA